MKRRTLPEWRAHHGLNKAELCRLIKVSPSTYSDWEDNPKSIKIGNAEELAKLFGTTLDGIIFLPSKRAFRTNLKKKDKTV